MKLFFALFTGLTWFVSTQIHAQETAKWKLEFKTDIFSRHLWRGDQLGNSPAIEPEIALTKGNFGFSMWAATTFNDSYREIDFIVNYQILPCLHVSLYDYYNPVSGKKNKFWNYKGENMRHSIDFTAELAKPSFPVTLLAAVFLYGDKNPDSGKERFSTYLEPACNFKLAGNDFRFFTGLTPFSGYYSNGFAFINTGVSFSRTLSLGTQLELPVGLTVCTNPSAKKTWVIAGIGIKTR